MATSSVASPLCTWLVAACMSVACDSEHSRNPSLFQSSKRVSRWARRRKVMSKCISGSSQFNRSLISSFYGSSIQSLMSSCIAFEPCDDYYSSKGLSSLGLFGDNGFSLLFGSKNGTINRRQRRMNRATHSGEAMAVALEPAKEVTTMKKPFTKQRRVVVTGLGVVTPLGHDLDVFYNNLLEGVSGISEIETFDCAQYPTRIAGEIKSFSTDGWCGVLIGSAMGGMKVFYDAIEALRISYRKMNPFCVPFATTNMGSAILAMDLGWMGPNYSISTACATSNFCILNAANHIIRGEADVMLCGGSDAAIIPIGLGGFVACRALSQRNSDPTKASRPWDINRDGFVMGEGAGVLLLEELEHAKKRGANIYAEFLGGSFSCDAYHMTEPHPDGAGVILCIEKALAQSGVSREDVNYINAHATSTPAGDLKEYQALLHCFGKNRELRVNSTKSMIGHLLGAAGGVEAVATVQAIRTGWVHPNINLENPDAGVDTKVLVGAKKERLDIKAALSNSFGFGGHNSSILFAPYK
ncbi:3-oxoacyl-[acyl-carrier-protein] synthase [Quillaja saponaria]|uniref:beta-ketoacyl-[acyl-carrier-protein] synthase I n=1 Tax=Quillaja saponaria TaxID=32244 RepID=A0AAD7LDA0_QUISA|nr:3-oxoacyl-[acyl-carrier-protein] synthase [Quillaja saponaria]